MTLTFLGAPGLPKLEAAEVTSRGREGKAENLSSHLRRWEVEGGRFLREQIPQSPLLMLNIPSDFTFQMATTEHLHPGGLF